MSDCGRCTGHCCAGFSLGAPPEKLFKNERFRNDPENVFIKDMLIYLGEFPTNPAGKTTQTKLELEVGKPGHFYTCKHYDPVSKDCAVYDHRPKMCEHYPNGSRCIFLDCTCVMSLEVLVEEAWDMFGGRGYLPEWTQKLVYGHVRFFKVIKDQTLKGLDDMVIAEDSKFLEPVEEACRAST